MTPAKGKNIIQPFKVLVPDMVFDLNDGISTLLKKVESENIDQFRDQIASCCLQACDCCLQVS